MARIPNLRWWVAGLLAAANALACVDRQTLPIVSGEVGKTIPITDQQFVHLQFTFLLAYGIMYAGGGKITDMLEARSGTLSSSFGGPALTPWRVPHLVLSKTTRGVDSMNLNAITAGELL